MKNISELIDSLDYSIEEEGAKTSSLAALFNLSEERANEITQALQIAVQESSGKEGIASFYKRMTKEITKTDEEALFVWTLGWMTIGVDTGREKAADEMMRQMSGLMK